MRKEFLKKEDCNVIQLDWEKGANKLGVSYTQATANTRLVGAEIAYMIDQMTTTVGAKPEKFHIIGHSLGAHVAGYAGERLKYLGRITGLDPADPYFSNTQPAVRLDESDALFVDVMHTDSARLLNLIQSAGAGIKQVCGHVDFYPNGGEKQPNCPNNIFEDVVNFAKCNHNRALYLFIDSINSQCKFKAIPCDSYSQFKNGQCTSCGQNGCSYMGSNADQGKPPSGVSGVKYYLDTNGESPFCTNTFIVRVNLGRIGSFMKVRPQAKYYLQLIGSNGNTEEMQLNSNYRSFEGDKSHNFVVSSKTNPGTIKSLKFQWKARYSSSSNIPVTINSIKVVATQSEVVQGQKYCGTTTVANLVQDLQSC